MGNEHRTNSGVWMMLASSVLFATGGLALKWIDWNPLAINGVRSLFGLLTIGGFMWVTRRPLVWNRTVAFGAVCYMVMTTLFVLANKMTTAANAIVLQYSCPVWIVLINGLLFHKKPQRRQWLVLGCVMVGIICFFASSMGSGQIAGDLAALISGLFYALLFMMNGLPGGNAMSSVVLGMAASFVLLSPFALREPSWSLADGCVLVYLGVFQVGLAYVFFSLATARISALQASLINGVEPVLNPLLVAVFAHETPGVLQIVGACIVIASVLFDALASIKQPQNASVDPMDSHPASPA